MLVGEEPGSLPTGRDAAAAGGGPRCRGGAGERSRHDHRPGLGSPAGGKGSPRRRSRCSRRCEPRPEVPASLGRFGSAQCAAGLSDGRSLPVRPVAQRGLVVASNQHLRRSPVTRLEPQQGSPRARARRLPASRGRGSATAGVRRLDPERCRSPARSAAVLRGHRERRVKGAAGRVRHLGRARRALARRSLRQGSEIARRSAAGPPRGGRCRLEQQPCLEAFQHVIRARGPREEPPVHLQPDQPVSRGRRSASRTEPREMPSQSAELRPAPAGRPPASRAGDDHLPIASYASPTTERTRSGRVVSARVSLTARDG